MLATPQRLAILECLSQHLGQTCALEKCELAAGGDINTSYQLTTDKGCYFVKTHPAPIAQTMYHAEWVGLVELSRQTQLKVPQPLGVGQGQDLFFLIMENLHLGGRSNDAVLGKGLAALHQQKAARFGFAEHNFIGTTPQINTWSDNWAEFWWQCRLQPQLCLAYENGYRKKLQPLEAALQQATEKYLGHHQPIPALVHGDLWRGNVGFDQQTNPCIFDPASYYGDREVDLAMTQLFGGFSAVFYQAYQEQWPLPSGHQARVPLYNLYHLLNHLNLFGGGYLGQCLGEIDRLTKP